MGEAKTRVAIYIRIGGNGDYNMNYELQKKHYAALIEQNPDWVLCGFYADLGDDSRKQPHLGRLAADCREGRIDLVIAKSTSRLSRNLSELMRLVRELACMNPPIGVYFEDMKFNTLEYDKFLMLSMCEAIAIKENQTKNERMPFAQFTKHIKIRQKLMKNNTTEDKNHE